MMIVWGHNNFRLKSVDPSEIGLLDKSLEGYKFELRQKYGHLFWIPFIPLEKMWVVRKHGNELYHCNPQIEELLKERFPIRTSIWAWTGPLLIIAGFIIFNISEKMSRVKSEKYAKENYQKANTALQQKLNDANQNDYLLFSVKEGNHGYYSYSKIPLKVLQSSSDSISLGVIYSPYEKEKNSAVPIKSKKARVIVGDVTEATTSTVSKSNDVNAEADVANLEISYGITDNFKMAKKDLLKAICSEYSNENNFAGIKLNSISSNGTCMLKDIWHIEGAIPKQVYLDKVKNDGKYFELENKGFDAHADSIVSIDANVEWLLSQKRDFSNGDVIALKTNGQSKAILYCSDKSKRIYKYFVDNLNYSLRISTTENTERQY